MAKVTKVQTPVGKRELLEGPRSLPRICESEIMNSADLAR
jgi:hypothetical protein